MNSYQMYKALTGRNAERHRDLDAELTRAETEGKIRENSRGSYEWQDEIDSE